MIYPKYSTLSTFLLLIPTSILLQLSFIQTATAVDVSIFAESNFHPSEIIRRDVAVIGGGSSGVYTSIRLRDHNKSVVVAERQDHLGGHAHTYTDPESGLGVNLGVAVVHDIPLVRDYFGRFNITLVRSEFNTSGTDVDFSSGKDMPYLTRPSASEVEAALSKYGSLRDGYPELDTSFNLTYPVEPDLLLPFGEYVKKHELEDMIPTIFIVHQGYVPLLNITTLYILKHIGPTTVDSYSTGFYEPAGHIIGELYDKAGAALGEENVLLGSEVVAMDRSNKQVKIIVNTPSGRKLILAKKLVSTAPPIPSNLKGYDLSDTETTLFSKFFSNGYYSAILKNAGLPADVSLHTAAPDTPYNLPELPGIYYIAGIPTPEPIHQVFYGSPRPMRDEDVKADIMERIHLVQDARGVPRTEPEWLVFANHLPFNVMVSDVDVAGGFYDRLFALQGERSTFYNGAAWSTQDSSILWGFTESYLLPRILGAL